MSLPLLYRFCHRCILVQYFVPRDILVTIGPSSLSVQSYTCTYTNYASQIKWMNWDNFPNNPSQKKNLFSTSIDAKIILALTSFFWGRHCMHVGVSGGLRREMREGEKEPFHCRILRH